MVATTFRSTRRGWERKIEKKCSFVLVLCFAVPLFVAASVKSEMVKKYSARAIKFYLLGIWDFLPMYQMILCCFFLSLFLDTLDVVICVSASVQQRSDDGACCCLFLPGNSTGIVWPPRNLYICVCVFFSQA